MYDSIWSRSSFSFEDNHGQRKSLRVALLLDSIFDPKPSIASQNDRNTSSSSLLLSPLTDHPHHHSMNLLSPRYLLVQTHNMTIALESPLVHTVTKYPGESFLNSGPLVTTIYVDGRDVVFSDLASLMGRDSNSNPMTGAPIVIIGDTKREAAILVDEIVGVEDAKWSSIVSHDLTFPHQKKWLILKNGHRAAVLQIEQLLDRVLFEIK